MEVHGFKAELLKQEIDLVMQKINHFDNLRHHTKQMAVTLWAAIIGVGLTGKTPLLLILFAVVVPIPFWYLDARYHAYQEGYSLRRSAIEAFLNDRLLSPGISSDDDTETISSPIPDYYGNDTPLVKKEHKGRTRVARNAFTKRMLIFYLPICVTPIALTLLRLFGFGM
jgi:hypothetical protein